MKYDVFISYSSKDIEVALIVCKMLEEHDIKCWMAPINIPSGVEYEDLVVDARITEKFQKNPSKQAKKLKFQ